MSLLELKLVRVPEVLGIYGKTKNEFPATMARLETSAAQAFITAQNALGVRIRVSDMFRTAEQSLLARQQKSGVQPPGFSLHNYGIAIDVDTDAMLKATKLTKAAFDTFMREHGWFCHRKDGKRGFEDWHFNHLGTGATAEKFLKASAGSTNTSAAGDARIRALHGDALELDKKEAQEALLKLRFYSGEVDGKHGPRTQEAIKAFQRAWKLPVTGTLDPKSERTLAYVSCAVSESAA